MRLSIAPLCAAAALAAVPAAAAAAPAPAAACAEVTVGPVTVGDCEMQPDNLLCVGRGIVVAGVPVAVIVCGP